MKLQPTVLDTATNASRPADSAAAHLITLWTRGGSPLLALDPRAGQTVADHILLLHHPQRRILAWAVLADRVSVLATVGPTRRACDTATAIRHATTPAVAALGHSDPWCDTTHVLPIQRSHDLGHLLAFVLNAPARAGLGDSRHPWRWVGSCQWPKADLAFAARTPSYLLWLDALTEDTEPISPRWTEQPPTNRRRVRTRTLSPRVCA